MSLTYADMEKEQVCGEDEITLADIVHEKYAQAGFSGPADLVDWMERTAKMGLNPIMPLKALLRDVCDVRQVESGTGVDVSVKRPTLIAWYDRCDQNYVLEIREGRNG